MGTEELQAALAPEARDRRAKEEKRAAQLAVHASFGVTSHVGQPAQKAAAPPYVSTSPGDTSRATLHPNRQTADFLQGRASYHGGLGHAPYAEMFDEDAVSAASAAREEQSALIRASGTSALGASVLVDA